MKYEETQQMARDARNLLNLQILEIRALKNRTGCETIGDYVLMFRELIHMNRLETAKILIQDALINKKKTEEFFELINKIILFEDETIKMREELGSDKLLNGLPSSDRFVNYDEVAISKINIENKEDFA